MMPQKTSLATDGAEEKEESKGSGGEGLMAELKVALQEDFTQVTDGIVGLFGEHGEELAEVGKEYVSKLAKAGAQVVVGNLSWEEFEEISENYWNAARSKLLTEGLEAKAEVINTIISGAKSLLSTGIKAVIALA